MIKKNTSFLASSLLLTCLISSQTTQAVTVNSLLLNDTISLEQVTKDVTYLASDDLKGRGNFTAELSHAAHYIAERFKENGLHGLNNIAKHDLSQPNIQTDSHSDLNSNSQRYLQSYLQTYNVSTITPKTLSVVLNGQAIIAENLTIASTASGISWQVAKGINEGISKSINNEGFTLHHVNENDDMRTLLSKLNNEGGNHLFLVNPVHEKTFHRYQHYFQRGVTKLTDNKNNKVQGGTIVIALNDTAIEAVQKIEVSAVNTISTQELTNVVAVLPGKTKPNEIVLYSAHYDHLGKKDSIDITEKNTEDTIYNGADDDASGTTAIINIAQHYAMQNNNARTLMFAAFSAEEIGGFGSQFFSKQLDPKTITAMINIEMIGKQSKFGAGTLWMTGIERSNLGEQLNHVLAKQDKEIHPDPYPEQGLFYRSDNATLAKLGVPAHSFSSSQLDKDQHYHQVSDDLSSLNLPSLHQVIQTLAIGTQPLVDGSVTPSRIDTSKVKTKGLIF